MDGGYTDYFDYRRSESDGSDNGGDIKMAEELPDLRKIADRYDRVFTETRKAALAWQRQANEYKARLEAVERAKARIKSIEERVRMEEGYNIGCKRSIEEAYSTVLRIIDEEMRKVGFT